MYHGDPEKSLAAHLRPGVFTLGEVGFVDGDGYVYITDRVSDMVLSGGVNIYPAESEQVLAEHPEVSDVAVIGIPHAEMGEQLLALVVPVDTSAPPPAEELIAFCRQRLAHYKCPRIGRIRVDRRPHDHGEGQQACLEGTVSDLGFRDRTWIGDGLGAAG